MTTASGVNATIRLESVPVIAAAQEYVSLGIAPGGTHANWRFLANWVSYSPDVAKHEQLLLCDAQTSGGLLASVPADQAEGLVASLQAAGVPAAAVVGQITGLGSGQISVTLRLNYHATETISMLS